MLQDWLLVIRVQQLENIFSLRMYEIAFFIYYSGFGKKIGDLGKNVIAEQ
jgi:hypothetical protein